MAKVPGATQRKVRDFAARERLLGVDYLHRNGRVGARGKKVHRIRLHFETEKIIVTPHELGTLRDLTFNLGKGTDDE